MLRKRAAPVAKHAVFALAICMNAGVANTAEVTVAVAANFTATAKRIAAAFAAGSEHVAVLSFGSTGKLYAQIAHGAPYDVLLAADQARPQKAIDEGLAVAASRYTYASGKLVLYSTDAALVDDEGNVLHSTRFARLAIANPDTAPYGSAAIEVLQALGVHDKVADRLVRGDNIAQTLQFVVTKNAQLGFVALAQIIETRGGSRWIVPEGLYTPVRQDAVLLARGASNPAARAFMEFLKSETARDIIRAFGYGIS